jgi:hypothetical protein
MRARWHFKRRFHILIQDRDTPFKMWTIIIKLMICLYMGESIQTIKQPLNSIVILSGLKKNHISRKNELFVYLIIIYHTLVIFEYPKKMNFKLLAASFFIFSLAIKE